MRKLTIILLASVAAAGCSQGGQDSAAADVTNTAAAKAERPAYCFFTDDHTRGWTASVDDTGNVVVRGEAYAADARYMGKLEKPEVDGTTATVQLGMPQNDTGHASADNWWDVESTIPASAAVQTVNVMCGSKTVASLEVPRKS